MNLELLESLHRQSLHSLPVLSAAMSLGWLFILLTRRWLDKAWLRWPTAVVVGAIAWIPYQSLPIGAYISPITGSMSLFSMLLMLVSIQLGRERLFPASVWTLLLMLSVALGLDMFAALPFRLLQWGYLADPSRTGQIAAALVIGLLILLIAIKRPIVAAFSLLPALCWRLGLSPSPNLWECYVDLPLAFAASIGLIGHLKSSVGQSHG